MKRIAIALMFCSSLNAFAEKASESKPLDLPDFSNLQQPAKKSGDGINLTTDMNCKTTDGQSYSANDTGFASCMANSQGHKR